jgi:histidinol-phosphatase (PHP family)
MNEFNKYFREIEKFNKEFGQHIKAGIEVGYAPPKEERIRKILSDYPFDFVLGSCHALDGKLIFEEPIFREMTRENVTKTYFHTISQMITSGLFDSIAHMDVIRHGRFVYGDFPFSCYKNEMEEIAKELKQRNMCFEINTNPYRAESGKPALYPCEEALKVLYEKGAHKITLGSDAHTIERIGEGLPAAVDILKEIGFKNVYLFNKRKESHIELSMLR